MKRPSLRTIRVLVGFGLVAAVLVALVVAVGRGGSSSADTAAAASPMTGHPAPPLAGTTLSGEHYRWEPRGEVTVVNIWAAWCTTCREELPMLSRLARKWSDHGVRLVTIDAKDGPAAARSLLREVGATGMLTVQDPHGRRTVAWGATGVPETVVVDRHGIIRARWLGAVDKTWLNRHLRQLTGPGST